MGWRSGDNERAARRAHGDEILRRNRRIAAARARAAAEAQEAERKAREEQAQRLATLRAEEQRALLEAEVLKGQLAEMQRKRSAKAD